jgi:deazaflavin-dependent oxidoreductase (nitroreductase family)
MEDELVASGRFVRIEMRGSRSGLVRAVTIGYVDDEAEPGSLLVAAGVETAWAGNLVADPACHVRTGDRAFDAVAYPLDRTDHVRAIRGLILRYGTPAEGLGRGPSFRLRPVEPWVPPEPVAAAEPVEPAERSAPQGVSAPPAPDE